MKNLLKVFGIGLLGGMGTRAGCMLMEAMFPKGLGGFFKWINTPPKEEPEVRYQKQQTGAPPNRSLVYLFNGKGR